MKALGIVLANQPNVDLLEIARLRTLAAVPFGGRYRLVDFALSNMSNAGINHIGIIMNRNYSSLMRHLALGADWDLDRKTGGLELLPPFEEIGTDRVFDDTLKGLLDNKYFLMNNNEKYVVLCDCKYIKNIDLEDAFDFHKKSGAAITVVTSQNVEYHQSGEDHYCVSVDYNGQVDDYALSPTLPEGMSYMMHTMIIERNFLLEVIAMVEDKKKHRTIMDVICDLIGQVPVMAYQHQGTILCIDTLSGYLQSNLSLLNQGVRDDLFNVADRPIFTNTQDSAPTKFGKNASVENSYIAAGCVIDGKIKNSIIFRGVKVEKDAVIENSVIMQDAEIGQNVHLNYAVLDKHVTIYNNRQLSGYITHPYFCQNRAKI